VGPRVHEQRAAVRLGAGRYVGIALTTLGGPRPWHTVRVSDDEELLAKAEAALTEIKVNQGLSDHHASVLAALRIRLKGSAGESLDELLAAAGDVGPDDRLAEEIERAQAAKAGKPSLDDLLTQRKPKRDWPS
jgi:hypothetical protein